MNLRIVSIGVLFLLASLAMAGGAPVQVLAAAEDHYSGHDEQGYVDDHKDEHGHVDDHKDEHGHVDDHEDEHGHAAQGEICPEHRVPEEIDALCHGDHIGELQPGQGMKVRLAGLEVARKAGVKSSRPSIISLEEGIFMPARVEFDRNRLVHITPLAAGVTRQVKVQPGATVKKGEVLAEVAMLEIASLKAELLAAIARQKQTKATYNREKDLLGRGISSRQEFQQAESEYHTARSASNQYRQQLQNYGLSPDNIEKIIKNNDTGAVVPFRAPFGGTVVEVKTAQGEAVAPAAPLFIIADLNSLWVELSVPESRVYLAQNQAPIEAQFDGLPGMVFSGRIFQIGSIIDERTRTLKVLAQVDNSDHRLKVGMFGNVRILQGNEQQVMAIPAGALQDIDGRSYVFIEQEADLFELRRIQAGAKKNGMVPVLAGLNQGETVVSSQGFSLKSEVLKARLGASCADH